MKYRLFWVITLFVIGFVAPLSAAIVTVGVYDENVIQPNTIEYTAAGSSFDATTFGALIQTAFLNNNGGVIDATVLGGDPWSFGVGHVKLLSVQVPTNWSIGAGYGISGTGYFSVANFPTNTVTFVFGPVTGGTANEHVVQFGVTLLSATDEFSGLGVDWGTVSVVATLSDNSQISSSRVINEFTQQGDTFFGFAAPAGQWITQIHLSAQKLPPFYGGLKYDDLGFITADVNSVPEPSTQGAVLLVLLLVLGAQVRARRRRSDLTSM